MTNQKKNLESYIFKILFIIFIIIFFSNSSVSKDFNESEVKAAVETWVRYVTANARATAYIDRMEPIQIDSLVVAYVAHLADSGFCICGANDLVLPVYLYNPRGEYDPKIPDYQFIFRDIYNRRIAIKKGIEDGDPEITKFQSQLNNRVAYWQNLISGIVPSVQQFPPDTMALILTSHWHQRSPYNDDCPELTPGQDEHTVVGCVATAMSQIMYYWKWPFTGEGSGSTQYNYRWRTNWDEEPLATDPVIPANWAGGGRLEWTAANGGRLRMNGYWDGSLYGSAQNINIDPDYQTALQNLWNRLNTQTDIYSVNFSSASYNWNILQDEHLDPPNAGDAEVARLCYHAGVSVGMGYGIHGSGASSAQVDDALEDHFRYDNDTFTMDRDINWMKNEIEWMRPIVLWGYENGMGHAWVVYGYNILTDPDRQFLMNMGWGPTTSAVWYSCDDIYANNQGIVLYMAPEDVINFVGRDDMFFGDGSPDEPYRNIDIALSLCSDRVTLIFKAGSDNTFSGNSLIINRPLTLKGHKAIIRPE
jgi:hypothetical protein